MNTQELEKILARLPIHTGVYAADERPPDLGLPGAYIFNLDPAHMRGSHWVAVFVTRHHRAEYMDTFARLPPDDLHDYLNKYVVTYNDKIIQDPLSSTCGAHCLSFLFHRYKGIKMKDYVKLFSHDLLKNDKIVSDIVQTYIVALNCM